MKVQLMLWRAINRYLNRNHDVVLQVYGIGKLNTLKSVKWKPNISQLSYINVPRLSLRASLQGISLSTDHLPHVNHLNDLGLELNYVLAAVAEIVNQLQVNSVSITELKGKPVEWVGATVSFDELFRTKNGPRIYDALQKHKTVISGRIDRDPHIYVKLQRGKLIMPIDPRWITTHTATGQFSSGQQRFAGLCTIKAVNGDDVVATPLVLGTPKSPYDFL